MLGSKCHVGVYCSVLSSPPLQELAFEWSVQLRSIVLGLVGCKSEWDVFVAVMQTLEHILSHISYLYFQVCVTHPICTQFLYATHTLLAAVDLHTFTKEAFPNGQLLPYPCILTFLASLYKTFEAVRSTVHRFVALLLIGHYFLVVCQPLQGMWGLQNTWLAIVNLPCLQDFMAFTRFSTPRVEQIKYLRLINATALTSTCLCTLGRRSHSEVGT